MIDISQFISFFNTLKNRLPPLQSLLAFDAATRLGGFSRAADELSLTQSAISHQIQNLEEWVGQRLFRRVGRGVKLTAAGVLFAETVQSTLKMLREGCDRIEPYRNMNSVILACPAIFSCGWLIPRLSALKATNPTLEIWLVTQKEHKDIDRIDVDLIISSKPLESPTVESIRFADDKAIAVCGPRMAPHLRKQAFPDVLKSAPLIIDEHRPEWAPWLAENLAADDTLLRSITVDDPRLQLNAAEHELGIALVSQLEASALLKSGRIKELPQIPTFSLPGFWLTKSRLTSRTPAVEAVFAWLCTQAR